MELVRGMELSSKDSVLVCRGNKAEEDNTCNSISPQGLDIFYLRVLDSQKNENYVRASPSILALY